LKITISKFGRHAVRLSLVGNLDVPAAEKLEFPLATISGCGGDLVVDMTRIDSITSIGIRHLVSAARTLSRRRARLLLLGPNPLVTNRLMTAHVPDLLPIVRSEDEARAAFDWYAIPSAAS
jgi:anti-anti-sigma factor